MNVRFAQPLLAAAGVLRRSGDRLTALVYDHIDATLLPSEEVPVDPPTRPTAAPGKAVVAGVEYHIHIPPHGPDDEQLIRAAVARGRGWR